MSSTTSITDNMLSRWRDSFFSGVSMHLINDGQHTLGVEKITVQGRPSPIRNHLSQLDAEMSRWQPVHREETVQLAGVRDRSKEATDIHLGTLAHIRSLNADVLRIIFDYAHHEDPEMRPPQDTLDANLAPWTFGRVCRNWRAIAWSYPRLWSDFSVSLSSVTAPEAGEMARQVLSRSRQHALKVHVSWSGEELPPQCVEILDALASHSSHWKTVLLDIHRDEDPDHPVLGNLATLTGKLPLLESIRFCPGDMTCGHQRAGECIRLRTPLRLFSNAPRLSDVTIYDFFDIHRMIEVPWRQLTRLNCEELTPEDTYKIVSQTPALTHATLSVSLSARFTPIITFPQAITLSRLTHLRTRSAHFLDFLTLPALEDLHIGWWCDLRTFVEAVPSLVKRSSCTLRSINIPVMHSPPLGVNMGDIAVELIQHVPSLRRLNISFSGTVIVPPVMKALASFSEPLVQHLETLNLDFYDSIEDARAAEMDNLLLALIEARWRPLADATLPLREFHVMVGHRPAAWARSRIQILQEEGLDIDLDIPQCYS